MSRGSGKRNGSKGSRTIRGTNQGNFVSPIRTKASKTAGYDVVLRNKHIDKERVEKLARRKAQREVRK